MPIFTSRRSFATSIQLLELLGEEGLIVARKWAFALGVPLPYLFTDNSDLAEVILAFGLLPEPEQRRLALELKARVSPPAACTRPARKARATTRKR